MERQIGPYAILSPLGAGGMGEVYRAHDAKLGRDIALKLLPRELADDPDRRARMLREARAAASLNHPNICTIYEVGEADGQHFIAMEVIDGQPLSHRLAAGLLSLDEILPIAGQLADAVAHAHDRGIVHRDLKGHRVVQARSGRTVTVDDLHESGCSMGCGSWRSAIPDDAPPDELSTVRPRASVMLPEKAL